MSLLARVKIITKILSVILLLAAVAIGTSWLGIHTMASMNAGANNMSLAAQRALDAARANQGVIALNRSEFRIALDPSPENRTAVHGLIEQQMKFLDDQLAGVEKTRDQQARDLLTAVKEAMAGYKRDLQNTLALADGAKDVQLGDTTIKLRDSVMKSRDAAQKLQGAVKAVADRLVERVEYFAKDASDEYETASRLLMIIAALGVIFGVVTGYLIGQFGIVKPINLLKAVMEAFANNNLKAEVPGVERRDELGDMARTVEVFKKNGLEVERMRADQLVTEKRNAEQRRSDMNRMANDFEGAVGEIIETVSSASTELEASAGTLTTTAERAQEAHHHGRRRLRGGLHQRAVGGLGDRGTGLVGQRDQPPGAGIGADGQRGGRPGAQDQRPRRRIVEGGRPDRRRGRTDQYHRRPDQSAGAERHHRGGARRRGRPRLCRGGVRGEGAGRADREGDRRDRPADRRHPGRDPGIGRRDQGDQRHHRKDCRRSPRPSRRRWKSRARRPRRFRATCSRPRRAPSRSRPTSPTCSAAPSETGSASSQVLSAAQSLSRDSNRLKLEVGKFLDTVRAA